MPGSLLEWHSRNCINCIAAGVYSRTEQLNAIADGEGMLNSATSSNRHSYPASKHSLKMKTSHSKLNFGDAMDDVHVGLLCLRAIMNHQVCT